jgi:hypothetical protein
VQLADSYNEERHQAFNNILIGELFKCIHQNRYPFLDVRESGRRGVWVNLPGGEDELNFTLKRDFLATTLSKMAVTSHFTIIAVTSQ